MPGRPEPGDGGRRTLLVNFFYAHPVGHAVEALRYALGYHIADPALRIDLVLNRATATELADFCPFVGQTYAVGSMRAFLDWADPARDLAAVPAGYDYVVDDARSRQPAQLAAFPGLASYYGAAARHFRAGLGGGVAGESPPAYVPHGRLALDLPAAARQRARGRLGARAAIAVMPAGSGDAAQYPSAASWKLIVSALRDALPAATICVVGKLRDDGRTSTSFAPRAFEELLAAAAPAIGCVDEPLADQLALVEACDVFVSPHTGFGMATAAVGTPWLTIAGGPWHEYFFNGVPFHSVVPDRRYPGYTWTERLPTVSEDVDGTGPRVLTMTRARILDDLDEIADAAVRLVRGQVRYEDALAAYFPRLLDAVGGDRSRIFSFDGIHERYL